MSQGTKENSYERDIYSVSGYAECWDIIRFKRDIPPSFDVFIAGLNNPKNVDLTAEQYATKLAHGYKE